MTKTLLLAAAAVTALVAAGSAQAGSLSARAGTGGAPVAVAPNNLYKLASELNFNAGVASTTGQFDTIFTFNTPLQPGSYTVTMAYTGATISPITNATVNSGTAAVANPTAAFGFEVSGSSATPGDFVNGANGPSQITIAGQTNTQVTFSLQIPAGNSVTSIFLAPALLVQGSPIGQGNVSVTAAVTNQVTGFVNDPAVIQPLISLSNRAFATRVNRTITAADGNAFGVGAGLDTRVEEGTTGSAFNTLLGRTSVVATDPYQIGQVDIKVAGTTDYDTILGLTTASTTVYRDLNATAVTLADVVSATITTRGIFTGLNVLANNDASAALASSAITTTGTTNTIVVPGGPNIGTTTVLVFPASTTATAQQLSPSDYDVSLAVALAPAFNSSAATLTPTGTPSDAPPSFEMLQTDGFSYIIPWVASQTLSGASGNQSVIRISNIRSDGSTPGGRVYAQVFNSSQGPATVPAATPAGSFNTPVAGANLTAGRSVLVGTLNSTGELVLSSQSLQNALGDFGRADIRLTVATTASATNGANDLPAGVAGTGSSTIVVKRLIATANGSLTEMSVVAGSAGSEANLPVNQGVAY